MDNKERMEQLNASHLKNLEENAEKYPDIKKLLDDYKTLQTQERWTKDFLDGYLSCISDLTFIKRLK